MPLFVCAWPDGDVSFVEADDVEQAIFVLDEFGDADPSIVTRCPPGFALQLSPTVTREDGTIIGSWEVDELAGAMTAPGGPLDRAAAVRRVHERAQQPTNLPN
jgi:hypothetical protein